MSDTNEEKEVAVVQQNEASIPPQASATDTSNQDAKVSTDPSGEKYIRSLTDEE